MLIFELIFWIALVLFTINYFIYPFIVILLSEFKTNDHDCLELNESDVIGVTMIIAAYNEERVIKAKIENSLSLDYPEDKLQIIIVSDGSDDRTHEIASSFLGKNILAIHQNERKGKSAALNRAAQMAEGEIIVFSDANNDFNLTALRHLIKHFRDAEVGAVTGSKHVYDVEGLQSTKGDGLYWRYESAIKKAESNLGSISSGDGEIFAIRKSLFKPIDEHLINDDAAITFDVVKNGYRVLYERNAGSYENASKDLIDDFHVKVRMTAGGYQSVFNEIRYLFPPRNWFTLRFLLHKILRWLAPVFLISMFLSSLILIDHTFYNFMFWAQTFFYTLSFIGWLQRKNVNLSTFLYIPMYFSLMNLALFYGLLRYLKGQQKVQWRKAER